MKRFFHLAIGGVVLDNPGVQAIEKGLDAGGAEDWLRQGPYSWFIYSAGELTKWRDYLKTTVSSLSTSNASFILVELDPNTHPMVGYLTPDAWEWFKKPRQ